MPEVVIDSLESLQAYEHLGKGRVVMLFTAPSWCGPCRQFKSHWERTVESESDITFLYTDIDKVPDAAVAYAIQSVPTVFVYENGKRVSQVKVPQGSIPFIKDIRS